ncbi:beta-galactosidase [Pseudarthrobacter sp. SL88]|uniref:glycoside hydrolase family 35 protein n=1 Tax=Micrococcaceae TaxID=1268 RepID=UPI0006F94178|nr:MULTISPECIES: beta-galactosidase family protein [Micrococcaceae]KQQ83615.1 beta-galactosidase [Arthrobacter sp. Leaf137]MCY1673241.1 beta-galactosidase [Pseudarthrobacter sp. SL88]
MHTFSIGSRDFLLDGEPFRILSGAIHYFRVHPDLWADRIRKARLMGLNTIETYVPWNEHSPTPGSFRTGGGLDLGRFLDLVAAEGMQAIVRPGPYICAEWDNGGLPAWLFTEPGIGVRSSEPGYLAAVDGFMDQLLPIVVERQVTRGGPVILFQIENEYGAYGSDKAYLQHLVDTAKRGGVEVPLFTCDQPFGTMIEDGSLPGLHKTGTFGSRADERLAFLRERQPDGPLMCAEFWNGWFDNWGTHHHTTDAAASAAELDALLAAGASVNIYMFHGGTNFGFTNGANDKGIYEPTITSYDYDAPLTEDGHPTEKYFAFRDVIAKHFPVPAEVPERRAAVPASAVPVTSSAPLLDVAAAFPAVAVPGSVPPSETTGQYRGFFLYERWLDDGGVLTFSEIRDRAQFFLNGFPLGTLSRELGERSIVLPRGGVLQVLVEDQGRVNYGPRIGEAKGLTGPALLDGVEVRDWSVRPVDLSSLAAFRAAAVELPAEQPGETGVAGPAVSFATFEAEGPGDRFLRLDGWTKGNAFINGFNLGRYWSRGPQRTLYVPGPLIREGANELAVLELQGSTTREVRFVAAPDLGPDEK